MHQISGGFVPLERHPSSLEAQELLEGQGPFYTYFVMSTIGSAPTDNKMIQKEKKKEVGL
jgi:hypothetical protein